MQNRRFLLWTRLIVFSGLVLGPHCKSTAPTDQSSPNSGESPEGQEKPKNNVAGPASPSIFSQVGDGLVGVVEGAGGLAVDAAVVAGDVAGAAVETAGELASGAARATKSALDSAARLIGLKKEDKLGWNGQVARLPFAHGHFGFIPRQWAEQGRESGQAGVDGFKLFTDASSYSGFRNSARLTSGFSAGALEPDFSKQVVMVLWAPDRHPGQYLQIQRIDDGERIEIAYAVLTQSFECESDAAEGEALPIQTVVIDRGHFSQGAESLKKKVKLREVSRNTFCGSISYTFPDPKVSREIKGSNAQTSQFAGTDLATTPTATVFADRWGKVHLHRERFCPACPPIQLSADYPNRTTLLTIIDQRRAQSASWNGKLSIDGLYAQNSRLYVDLKRIVNLCDGKGDPTSTVWTLELDHADLTDFGGELATEDVVFPWPFVREDQVPCP